MQPDPFPRLTEAQLEQMRRDQREWQSVPPPCGIPHIDLVHDAHPVLTGKDDGDGYRYVLMPIRSAG